MLPYQRKTPFPVSEKGVIYKINVRQSRTASSQSKCRISMMVTMLTESAVGVEDSVHDLCESSIAVVARQRIHTP